MLVVDDDDCCLWPHPRSSPARRPPGLQNVLRTYSWSSHLRSSDVDSVQECIMSGLSTLYIVTVSYLQCLASGNLPYLSQSHTSLSFCLFYSTFISHDYRQSSLKQQTPENHPDSYVFFANLSSQNFFLPCPYHLGVLLFTRSNTPLSLPPPVLSYLPELHSYTSHVLSLFTDVTTVAQLPSLSSISWLLHSVFTIHVQSIKKVSKTRLCVTI